MRYKNTSPFSQIFPNDTVTHNDAFQCVTIKYTLKRFIVKDTFVKKIMKTV